MAIDFIKTPKPDEANKPPKVDFWKPPVPTIPNEAEKIEPSGMAHMKLDKKVKNESQRNGI